MRNRRPRGLSWIGVLAVVVGVLAVAGQAQAFSLTLSPHMFKAGSKNEVTLSAPQCFAESITVTGKGVLAGTTQTLEPHMTPGVFTGTLRFLESASSGSHALSVTCNGTNFGKVSVMLEGGGHPAPQHGVATQHLRIGWSYTHVNQYAERQHESALGLKWNKCYNRGGTRVTFPKSAGIYDESHNVPGHYSLDRHGKTFHGNIYVGATHVVGSKTVTLTCRKGSGPARIKEKLTLKFSTEPFHQLDYFPLRALTQGLAIPTTIRAAGCRDPHIKTLTLESEAFAPRPGDGAHTVAMTRSGSAPEFSAAQTGNTAVSPGMYPVSASCGGHLIASPMIQLLAMSD